MSNGLSPEVPGALPWVSRVFPPAPAPPGPFGSLPSSDLFEANPPLPRWAPRRGLVLGVSGTAALDAKNSGFYA